MQKWLRQMGIELVRSVENEIMYGIGFQEIILLFIFFVIPSVVGYKLAQIKNRNVVLWAFLCFIFPPILIVLVFLGKIKKDISTRIQCPYCREFILEEAIICKHCGSKLDKSSE